MSATLVMLWNGRGQSGWRYGIRRRKQEPAKVAQSAMMKSHIAIFFFAGPRMRAGSLSRPRCRDTCP